MNEYVAKITLDLNCQATPVVISAGQFDIGRKIQITLTADGEAYDATGATAVCKGKNNNNYFAVNAAVSKNIVTVTTDKAMLSSAGRTIAKIVLTDGTHTYSTQPFVINTHSDYDGDITTSDYYPELLDILSRVLALTESGAVLTDTKLSATSINPLQNKVLTPIINTINNRLQSAEQNLYSKANATDVSNALKSKEDHLNKVSSKTDITDRNTNYPSIKYLNDFYYDASEIYSSEEMNELLGNKADKVDVSKLKCDLNNKTKELWNFNDNNFESLNMLPKELTDGEYYRYTDGKKVYSAISCHSGFIRVKPETNYTISVPAHVCFYSNDYSFLSGVTTTWGSKTITTPELCKYVIVSFDIKFKDSIQMIIENSGYRYYSRGTVKVKENVIVPIENIPGSISINDEDVNQKDAWSSFKVYQDAKKVLNTIAYQKNLLKTNGWTNGFYKQYNSGLAVESERYSYSDFIEVLDNTEYATDANAHVCFYNADKKYVGGAVVNQSTGQTQPNFITPTGCLYIVISLLTNKIESSVLVEGNTKPQKYESPTKWTLRNFVEIPESNDIKSNFFVVDKSGDGDYNNVSDAVNAANDGTIIFVKNGVYEDEKIEAFQKKSILLASQNLAV